MSDPRQNPLQGAALYNPHLHGRQELVSLFVAREDLLELLLEDLRAKSTGNSPQHHLLIGQRGMGKTTLLHRLGYAIEEDPSLSRKLLPLTFPEEQYNVARLSDVWLNCAGALRDALERIGRLQDARDLEKRAEALRGIGESERFRKAFQLLKDVASNLDRKLVLLIDNLDLVLDRVIEQEWVFREALSSQSFLILIGTSSRAVETTFVYGRAFYDFFWVHELEGLDFEAARRLLIHYAKRWNAPQVRKVAEEDPSRIQVIHTLAGGNPRTMVLLFNVFALGADGDVRMDLEKLLDQCTPLYKARLEALAPQSQQVVHALAVHWDPVTAGELADAMDLRVNVVSSQLTRLVKQGIVEKVAYEPESKTGFQIADRFFGIWNLMRAGGRFRSRLLEFVEFLRIYYGQDQLRGERHQEAWRDLRAALEAARRAVQAGRPRNALQDLEREGAAERWRPLREALEALDRGTDSSLRKVAPEVRGPARQIFEDLKSQERIGR